MSIPLNKIGEKTGKFFIDHAPIAFGIVGLGCLGLGIYHATKETKESEEKRKTLKKGESKPVDYVKVLVPSYKKTLIFSSIGFTMIGASMRMSSTRLSRALFRESLKENAMIVARRSAYDVVGEAATSKIEEQIGEYYKKGAPEVDNDIYKISKTTEGSVLFVDGTMGGMWRSTVYDVKDGFVNANDILNDEEELDFNGFIECFPGRDKDYITKGFDLGYSKKNDNKFKIEILPSPDPKTWKTGVSNITGEPCYILEYTKPWEYPKFEMG